ncbi:hypothetical protein H696_02831 [Fonticula alba]|uniref:Cation efflux protein transmembrane domain-containing protein n=1 Tax=Fonticula alba TaxID=691883 RepID=A0A058Z8D2_FONAL|nr:hypothetical protein H696_02831 [Fonticula alba]KCV70490.1 hypothetical protein H696_02831 [Fonticula alba]|eukprot:XP_009495006.1 hypothetical protein H696_02831 [Fonticula alba]
MLPYDPKSAGTDTSASSGSSMSAASTLHRMPGSGHFPNTPGPGTVSAAGMTTPGLGASFGIPLSSGPGSGFPSATGTPASLGSGFAPSPATGHFHPGQTPMGGPAQPGAFTPGPAGASPFHGLPLGGGSIGGGGGGGGGGSGGGHDSHGHSHGGHGHSHGGHGHSHGGHGHHDMHSPPGHYPEAGALFGSAPPPRGKTVNVLYPESSRGLAQRAMYQARVFLRSILSDRRTRNVFFFLLLNLSFMVVEILYGIWSNSLGLIGDGLHMLFDSSALIGSLIASVIAKWPVNDRLTYGYGRVETLCGFVNALLLTYASGNILFEAIGRLISPEVVDTERLLTVAVLGLIVNLVGIFAFEHGGHGHSHGGGGGGHGHSHGGHGHSHGGHDDPHSNPLLQGMFLHILADTLGSVGVIASAILIKLFDWQMADPICSIFISVMIFVTVVPLLKSSAAVLMQSTPELPGGATSKTVAAALRAIPGVDSVESLHIWELASHVTVATTSLRLTGGESSERVRLDAVEVLRRQAGAKKTTVELVTGGGLVAGTEHGSHSHSHSHSHQVDPHQAGTRGSAPAYNFVALPMSSHQ